MGESTRIAWCDSTFNIAHGCFKISPGCKHCYAEEFTQRSYDRVIWGPPQTTDRRTFGEKHWNEPLKWDREAATAQQQHRRVFSSSMCDNWEDHPTITRERAKLWALIERTHWLDWLLLTKRIERVLPTLPDNWPRIRDRVWIGTSIEDNNYVWRADKLRDIRVEASPAICFVSYEPALGPLDRLDLRGIDWVIYGAESGPHYRSHDVQWARDMRARCRTAGVAFFYKQSNGLRTEMGIELDGQIVREYPAPRRPLPEPEEFTLS
jgi:protein gp37